MKLKDEVVDSIVLKSMTAEPTFMTPSLSLKILELVPKIDNAEKFNAAEAPQSSKMGRTGTTSAAASQPEDEEDEQVDKEGVEEKNSFCHDTSNMYLFSQDELNRTFFYTRF